MTRFQSPFKLSPTFVTLVPQLSLNPPNEVLVQDLGSQASLAPVNALCPSSPKPKKFKKAKTKKNFHLPSP